MSGTPQSQEARPFALAYHNRYVLGVVVKVPKRENGMLVRDEAGLMAMVDEYRPVKIVVRHRSKYNPHIGLWQRCRRDVRSVCGYYPVEVAA